LEIPVKVSNKGDDKMIDKVREQYPKISGLLSTLQQYKPLPKRLQTGLRIIHCRACHLVIAFKQNSSSDVVYDSMFDTVDEIVKIVSTNIWNF